MKKMILCSSILTAILFFSTSAMALDKLVQSFVQGCEKELTTYCKDVTPGQGRILACLYAHQDKISGRCDYALYDAAAQLQRVVASLTYVANECRDDLQSYCTNIKPGEGRLLDCMEKNSAKVSDRCKQAVNDVGLEKD